MCNYWLVITSALFYFLPGERERERDKERERERERERLHGS